MYVFESGTPYELWKIIMISWIPRVLDIDQFSGHQRGWGGAVYKKCFK